MEPKEGLFSDEECLAFVARVQWKFASTMPQWPHWYTVRRWRPDLDAEHVAFARTILDRGEVRAWPPRSERPRYHHSYLEPGDGFQYWIMEDAAEACTLINRARVGEPTSA